VHVERDRADLAFEPVDLDRADPVLTGDRAAEGQTQFQDVVEGCEGTFPLVSVGRVGSSPG
jgi:hypothetical protein